MKFKKKSYYTVIRLRINCICTRLKNYQQGLKLEFKMNMTRQTRTITENK